MDVGTISKRGNLRTERLSLAQILALPTTAVSLSPIPDAGIGLVPVWAILHCNWIANITNIAGTADVSIGNLTNNSFVVTLVETGGANQVTGLLAGGEPVVYFNPYAFSGALDADISGKALQIKATNAAAGNFTGGGVGMTLDVTVFYVEIPVHV